MLFSDNPILLIERIPNDQIIQPDVKLKRLLKTRITGLYFL